MGALTIKEIQARTAIGSVLTIIKLLGYSGNNTKVIARCICGNEKTYFLSSIIRGAKSCGCLQRAARQSIDSLNNRLPENSKLTVVAYNDDENGRNKKKEVIVLCECGNVKITQTTAVVSGRSLSCGCYAVELIKKAITKWHYPNRKIYQCFLSMKHRCENKKHKSYDSYGGRGVRVCNEWLEDPQKFIDWAVENGWKEGLQLDKDIKYVKKFPKAKTGLLYSPEFCSWVRAKDHSNHKRNTIKIEYYGELVAFSDIVKKVNIPYSTLACRLKKMNIYDAISYKR